MQPSLILQEPWDQFEVLSYRKEKVFVSPNESALYTLEASMKRNREKLVNLAQGLPFNVSVTSRALRRNTLEDICNAVIFLELYTLAVKTKREYSTGLDRRRAGLFCRIEMYREQEKGMVANYIAVTFAARKSHSNSYSNSDYSLATVHVPQTITWERLRSSAVSLERRVAVLLQACKLYLRLHSC